MAVTWRADGMFMFTVSADAPGLLNRTTTMKYIKSTLCTVFATIAGLTACGGESTVGSTEAAPAINTVTKTVVDAGLVYPYGMTVYHDASGIESVAVGNTIAGVISSPGGIDGTWICTNGLEKPQLGEVYRYQFTDKISKVYAKTYPGFIERSTFFKRPNGVIDLYFVENRDGHILRIDESTIALSQRPIVDQWISTGGARPYDVKVADMGGGSGLPDIVYSTYSSNQLVMQRATDGQLQVLADKMSENRTVELFTFSGDSYPSVITTGAGALKTNDPNTGWVSVVRNSGGYDFTEHRFDLRGAAYARLAALNSHRPDELHLIVSHGMRDQIQDSGEHGLSIYQYFADTNTISKVSEIQLPYAYRFDLQDLNGNGIQDIVIGGHDGSGVLTVLLSRSGITPTYDVIPIDQGLVAINDVKFGLTKSGVATLYLVADNGNGCPRKLGGSRLVRYQFALPVTAEALQGTKI